MDKMGIHYNVWVILLSFALTATATYFVLNLFSQVSRSTGKIRRLWLISGTCALGCGVWAIYYVGIMASRFPAEVNYYPGRAILSLLVGVLFCYLAFRVTSVPQIRTWHLVVGGILLGSGFLAMHYIGISVMYFVENDDVLLTGVSLGVLLMLAVSAGAVFLDRHVFERMAYHDPLTALPNRHGLERYFNDEFLGSKSGAVFFVDLDRFKSINDTLGHDIGDMLLQEVAVRLTRSVGDKGKIFRLGGDEFLIALPDCTLEVAQEEAGHIMHELKKFYRIQGNELYVTASVGISMTPLHGTDRSALMKAADTALYTSKDSGKNKCSVFDQEVNRNQLRRMSLEKDLRKALARSEFMVVYQPKWDSYMNVTVGLEALLRWRHPEHGIISPAEFIPIAEETGLIVPITYWMLHNVCSQNRFWHKEEIANVPVSINMSARMFEDGSLYDVVEEALTRSELEPHFLELEITESIAMNNMIETVAQLSRLRKLGVRVSLDDFGTGFSSLGNLDEIPVNTLKIDQVFIRNSKMHSKKAIISNIIAIATHLNMEVVAEGVETSEQIELLKSLGCRVMQGYYYGRPMPVHELGEWFIANTAAS